MRRPCIRHSVGTDENADFIIGGDTITFNPIPNRLPQRDLVLYDLMIDDFTRGYRVDAVPVDAVKDRIDYLENLVTNGASTVARAMRFYENISRY